MTNFELAIGVENHQTGDAIEQIKVVAIRPVPEDGVLERLQNDLNLVPDVLAECVEVVFDEERSKRPGRELQAHVQRSLQRGRTPFGVTLISQEVELQNALTVFEHLEDAEDFEDAA
jgi:hypothetical protein